MVHEFYIPECVCNSPLHHPPVEKPFRIEVLGPLVGINRLFSEDSQISPVADVDSFPQPGGLQLAILAFRRIYGRDPQPYNGGGSACDFRFRDEFLGWVENPPDTPRTFDWYGVVFDHLVKPEDHDPEVLQLCVMELEEDQGPFANGLAYARDNLRLTIDPADYIGKRLLVVPRCCSKKKGTTDRGRINGLVAERGVWLLNKWIDATAVTKK